MKTRGLGMAAMTAFLLATGFVALGALGPASAQTETDVLAADVSRWSTFLTANPATDDIWKQVRQGSERALARADRALRDGRRLLAALRLAPVREKLKQRYGDRIVVLAMAVESDEADVRKMAAELGVPLPWAIGTPEVARAFGDVTTLPTLFVFDKDGRTSAVFYGAPPELHAQAEAKIEALAGRQGPVSGR